MKTLKSSEKLSLTECKKILNVNGNKYSDAQILIIRNWLYAFTEISLSFIESKTNDELKELVKLFNKK